jgi:hypothetical protein
MEPRRFHFNFGAAGTGGPKINRVSTKQPLRPCPAAFGALWPFICPNLIPRKPLALKEKLVHCLNFVLVCVLDFQNSG